MEAIEHGEDVRAIEALIARQFASLSWAPGAPANWEAFAADFAPEASLYPAARPARRQMVEAFVERMRALAETKLQTFHEEVLGTDIRVFGNVAVAVAAGEMTENGTDVSRGIEMLLLVKDDGAWRIVSQAWDKETASRGYPCSSPAARPLSDGRGQSLASLLSDHPTSRWNSTSTMARPT